MTQHRKLGPRATWYAIVLGLLVALGGLGTVGAHELAVENAQAQSLVAQGRIELQNGDHAAAVISLERAKLLAPRAELVRSALSLANVGNVDSATARAVNWIAPREWSFLLVAFGWTAGLGLAVAIGRAGKARFARWVAVAAGLLFAGAAAGIVQSSVTNQALAVVTTATGVLVAPYQGAGATADLPPGVVVSIGSRYGDFIQVRGPDGARGWVTASALEAVVGS